MNLSQQMTGNVSMLIYVVMTALSSIMIHETNQQITPLLSAFYTFLFCLLVYGLLSKGLLKKITEIKKHWFSIFVLNATTTICWIFTFFALKYIPPELFLYIYLCAMPIASSLIYKSQLVKAFVYFIALIFLTLAYSEDELVVGFILAFLGGASGTIYSIYSKKLTHVFSTLEILSLRFYLIVFITCLISVYFNHIQLMSMHFYLKFMGLAVISIIFPLMLFQIGIKHLNIIKVLSYLPLAPLLGYLLNVLFNHKSFSVYQMSIILLMSMVMFIKTN